MTPPGTEAWLIDERWFKAYPLTQLTTIGRAPESTIILRDSAVSRHHADIRKGSAGYVLHALGSTGVKVNGMPVGGECALQDGDVVEIAFTTLRFTTRAPTNEMSVIPRDTPAMSEGHEGPTRVTIPAINRTLVLRGSRRSWRRAAIVLLIVALLLLVVATLRNS